MRNADIDTLKKVADALAKYLPHEEWALLAEYYVLYVRLKDKNDREKQHYQDNAEHIRELVKKWKEENPEKQKQYVSEYQQRKKREQSRGKNENG